MTDSILPSLSGLLNQFEAIGGPEEYGPEGIAIMVALWRKSSKLGWCNAFQMTNTELILQTGIRSRDTINTHRSKLVAAGLIEYSPPPKGVSRGDYVIHFDLAEVVSKPVRKSDNSKQVAAEPVRNLDMHASGVVRKSDYFSQVAGEPVQKSDYFSGNEEKVVQKSDAVFKDFKDFKDLNAAVVVVEEEDDSAPSKSDDEGMLLPRHGADPAAAADPDADSGQSGVSFTDYRKVIIDKFITRRARGTFLSPKDEDALDELAKCNVPLDTVLRGIDKAYDEYKPKHHRDAVRTLDYCVPIILDLHVVEQRKRETLETNKPRKSKQQQELEDLRRKREEARQRDQR